MNWLAWCGIVILSSVTYQTSMKIFSGRLPIFVYTTIAGLTMLIISLTALAATYKNGDFQTLNTRTAGFAVWLGCIGFMIELGFYFLYKNNAPLSTARMLILAGSASILLIVGLVLFKERMNFSQSCGLVFTLAGMLLLLKK